jgi:hypothetical protein
VVILGYTPGVSKLAVSDNQGAVGLSGATVQVDQRGSGVFDSKVTFVGLSASDVNNFKFVTGNAGGVPYLSIQA